MFFHAHTYIYRQHPGCVWSIQPTATELSRTEKLKVPSKWQRNNYSNIWVLSKLKFRQNWNGILQISSFILKERFQFFRKAKIYFCSKRFTHLDKNQHNLSGKLTLLIWHYGKNTGRETLGWEWRCDWRWCVAYSWCMIYDTEQMG